MNRSGSHQDLKNWEIFSKYLRELPASGPRYGTTGQPHVRENRDVKPPRKRPRGGGGTYRKGGMGVSTPISNAGRCHFFGNRSILIMTLSGALPPPLWHPPVAIVPYYLFAIVENLPVR